MTQGTRAYRSQAVILSRRDHGEADRLITLFTPALGKQEWIAKGIRKTTSRKAGHLELFTHATLLVAKARTWDIITEAATLESFRHLRTNLELIAKASYVCELIVSFTEQDDDNLQLWDLLLLTLRTLDKQAELLTPLLQVAPENLATTGNGARVIDQGDEHGGERQTVAAVMDQATLLLRWFEIHLLAISGFQPQLFTCLGCSAPIEPVTNYISLEDGGVFCPRCAVGKHDVEPIESNVLKILRHLQRSSWQDLQFLRVQPLNLLAVETILHRYLLTVLERQLKSVAFLRNIKSTFPQLS